MGYYREQSGIYFCATALCASAVGSYTQSKTGLVLAFSTALISLKKPGDNERLPLVLIKGKAISSLGTIGFL